MPNIFDNIKVQSEAPVDTGANSVNTLKLYKPNPTAQQETVLSNMFGSTVFTGDEATYNSLAESGAQPNIYQSYSELERLRAKNQSAWKQAANSLGQAIGTVIGDTVGGMGMLVDLATAGIMDDKPYSNVITRAGDKISDYVRNDLFPIYRENPDKAFDMDDFSGWFFSQVPSIASSLSLMIPGTAFAKGVGAVGKGVGSLARTSSKLSNAMNKVRKITKLDNTYNAMRASAIAKDGLTAIGMRLGENYQEARGVAEQINQEAIDLFTGMNDSEYNKWLEQNQDIVEEAGSTDKEAIAKTISEKAANRDFAYNSGNVFFDFMQLRAVNKMFGEINRPITPRLRYNQNQLLDRLASTGVEGASQTLGQAAKSTITGIAGKLNRLINSSENLLISELSEGVEEAVNYIGQEEGTAYGRYLLGQLEEYNNTFLDSNRIRNYLKDPQLYNSALWGIIGGVVFGGTMSAIRNRKGGISEEKMRLNEINGREQMFNNYANQMSLISQGLNPYEFERDANGNIVRYLDDGTVSQDSSVGTPRHAKLTPDEQEIMANEAKTRFISAITLNAIRNGNYELLQDYINDSRLKKKLIDSGLAEEATFDEDTIAINDIMQRTLNKYKNFSTAMRSANLDDAVLDIAISENIFDSDEAELMSKRIEKIQAIQNEIEAATPELAQVLDPMTKNRLTLAMLEESRKEAYQNYNSLKDSKNPRDKMIANSYKEIADTIQKRIDDIITSLTPADQLVAKDYINRNNVKLGLPDNELVKKEIEKFLETEDNKQLYKDSIKNFNLNEVVRKIKSINSEYLTNLDTQLMYEITRDNFNNRVSTTNEAVQRKGERIKAEQEAAAKTLINNATRTINSFVSTATDEDLALLNRILNNQATEEDRNNPKFNSLNSANEVISASKDRDKIINGIQQGMAKTVAHNERVKKAKEIAEQARARAVQQQSSSTGEEASVAKPQQDNTPSPPPVSTAPTPKTKEEVQLKETLDKLVETKETPTITNANIDNYTFTIKSPFASVHYVTGKPVKISKISINISKFGNVSIDGFDKSGNMVADVTIDEINQAIAKGDITNTPKDSDGALESSINDNPVNPQRLEELKLIINLYNQIKGNTIDGKNFTSINDMMVYLQRLNPNAVNLYNDLKIMANDLVANGELVTTDTELKAPNEIVAEANKDIKQSIAEKKKEDNTHSYYFDLINLDDAKVYEQIGKLKSGNTVTVELSGDRFIVKSRGLVIGELPYVTYENGNTVAYNRGWKYTIRDKEVDFIEVLKDIVNSKEDADKEFLTTLNNIRRLFRVRNNSDVENTFGHLLNTLQENDTWKKLNTLYGDDNVNLLNRIAHLNSIIFFDYNVELGTPYFADIVTDSLSNWSNKIQKSYVDLNNLRSSISKTKSKSKRLAIGSTSTGSLIFAKDGRGNPIYSPISDVATAESTDNFRIVRGGERGVIDVKTGQFIEASSIRQGVIGFTIRDSEGRLMTAPTRENTMDNSLSKATPYTKKFNEAINTLFTQLLKATHAGNVALHDSIMRELDNYIGPGRSLFGYRIQGKALIPNKAGSAPTVWFNVDQDNPSVRFVYPNGAVYTLSAYLPGTNTRPTATDTNFARAMAGVYSNMTRNVINNAVTNGSSIFRINAEGKLEAKIPNLNKEEWFDTGYSSYEEFVAKDGVVVTDLGAKRDSKGRIISNFNYTNDKFNKRITLVNPTRSKDSEVAVSSPVKGVVNDSSTPTALVQPSQATITGTPTEIARSLTTNEHLISVVSALEAAGLSVNPEIEYNEGDRLASIMPGTSVLTLTNNWQRLDDTQKVLKIVHEGVHFLLNDERANIEQQFGDIFDKFATIINSDEVLRKTYGDYLKEGAPRQVQIEEFVVEAITSRELARLLSSIKYNDNSTPSENLFTKILDALLDIIGKINESINGTMLGEIRSRLASISEQTETGATISQLSDDTHLEEDSAIPLGEDLPSFTDIEGLDLLDSAIIDRGNEVENLDSLLSGLTAEKQAAITRLFNEGGLSFICN